MLCGWPALKGRSPSSREIAVIAVIGSRLKDRRNVVILQVKERPCPELVNKAAHRDLDSSMTPAMTAITLSSLP
jgi:hypothetical protein